MAHPDTQFIPIIMISASFRDRDKALEAGVKFFFQKPCPPQTVLAALREVLAPVETVGVKSS